MFETILHDVSVILPEISLATIATLVLLSGLFIKRHQQRWTTYFAMGGLVFALLLEVLQEQIRQVAFNGLFIEDTFSILIKALIVSAALIVLAVSRRNLELDEINHFEYPVLVLFATLGMMVMVSANDLMTVFLGLELQSLSLYVMVAINRDKIQASEAAMKYFVLGALATGIFLYGCSLIYGFAGTTNFEALARAMRSPEAMSIGAVIGFTFILVGLAFKISVVPFHMWTPDVYEGSPTAVTTFLATVPKLSGFALIMRVLAQPFQELFPYWQGVLMVLAIATMLLGAFAALNQTKVKRILAYSSIGHVGYALIGIVANGEDGLRASLIYIMIYLVMTLGAFACLMRVARQRSAYENVHDLAGLAQTSPGLAFVFSFLLFSLAGIPPLAGFLGKLYVFQSAINAGLYMLAILGVLSSVVAAAYYLKLIKVMVMDSPVEGMQDTPARQDPLMSLVLGGTVISLTLFFIRPEFVIDLASAAAISLTQGLS